MIAKATVAARGIANVRFEAGDAERLRFDDGALTAVLCSNAFHHYPDPTRRSRRWCASSRAAAGS
jgi:ubiquinone/menaquinone biosynthesis C-methylase UbiE